MRKLTKTETLYIGSLSASSVLFFLSVSILVSNETSVIIPYASLLTAIALSSSTLIIGLAKKQKNVFPEVKIQPLSNFSQIHIEKSVIRERPFVAAPPTMHEQITQKNESVYRVQRTQPSQPVNAQPYHYPKPRESVTPKFRSEANQQIKEPYKPAETIPTKKNTYKPISYEKTTTNQESTKENGSKYTCPKCKKEFSQPIFMAEYDESKQVKLVGHCPYCDHSQDMEQKTSAEEELLKKIF